MADRTHSHDTSTPAMSAETVPSEEFVLVPHPGYGGKLYPAQTVLSDLAGQEGCDGEPYDTMQNVADALRSMKTRSHKLDAHAVIRQIVVGAENVASCAGVGSLETAGQIVSFLASRPSLMPSFMAGTLSAVDSGLLDHHNGVLSWHGMDGDIHEPDPSKAHFSAIPLEDLFSASTPNPSPAAKGGEAVREALRKHARNLHQMAANYGSHSSTSVVASAAAFAVENFLDSLSTPTEGPAAEERFDYLSDAQARELFGTEDDDELPDGRVRVCAGEWVRIPGGYYFDASTDLLHPETASEACDGCAVTMAPTEGPASQTEGVGGEAVRASAAQEQRWVMGDGVTPLLEGHYRVLIAGDSESVDGYTVYEFGDYEDWAYWEPAKPEEFEDFEGGYKGSWRHQYAEAEHVIGFCGPFHVPSRSTPPETVEAVPVGYVSKWALPLKDLPAELRRDAWRRGDVPLYDRPAPATDDRERLEEAEAVFRKIREYAENIAFSAGVGASEIAGQIVSFLVDRPELLRDFKAGTLSAIDTGMLDHHNGVLSYGGMDGKVHRPDPRKARFPAARAALATETSR